MHARPQMWGSPPYRHTTSWGATPFAKTPKPAPYRARELACIAAMVVAADVALFARAPTRASSGGFGLGVLFVALPIAIVVAARARRLSIATAVVGALLAAVAARSIALPTPLTTIAGLALVGVLTYVLRARRAFMPEMIATALYAVGKLPSRIGAAFAGTRKITSRTKLGSISVLPIVIPVALGAAFLGVFALANPVVAHGVGAAWSFVAGLGFPSPARIFAWLVFAVCAISLLRPALRLAKGSEAAPTTDTATKTSLLVSRNALALLNVIFLAYNALDAAYLWSGRPPAGMHTQQYAHEGAFWLTVALGMVTAVVGVMFRGALAHDVLAKNARVLAYVWMGQGVVLALGTYRRVAIHIATSGLSNLRIVAILGTTLVAIGLALVAYKLRRQRTFTWLVRRQLHAFALTFVAYALFPTDYVSAAVNVARVESGELRPVVHMQEQAGRTESAASLVPLVHHPDAKVRQGMAALLLDERDALRKELASRASWREHDVLTSRTLAALEAASPDMESALAGTTRTAARDELFGVSNVANYGDVR